MNQPPYSFEPAKTPRENATPPRSDADAHAIQQEPVLADRPHGVRERSAALFGLEFAVPKRRPIAALVLGVWALAAGSLFLFDPVNGWHVLAAVSSIPTFAAAIWCFFARGVFRVRFTAEGIETFRPNETWAYSEIMEIYAPDRLASPAAFDIFLLHAYGTVRIP